MFVQNWQTFDFPIRATYRGMTGEIIADRANHSRVLFRPDSDKSQNLDVSTELVHRG